MKRMLRRLQVFRGSYAYRLNIHYFPLVLLPVVLICAALVLLFHRTSMDLVQQYSNNITINLSSSIDDYLLEVSELCNVPVYNQQLQDIIKKEDIYPFGNEYRIAMENLPEMANFMSMIARSDIQGTYLYCSTGRTIFYRPQGMDHLTELVQNGVYRETAWYRAARDSNGRSVILDQSTVEDGREDCFYIAKIINDRTTAQEIGVLLMEVNQSILREHCGRYLVADDDRILVFGSGGELQCIVGWDGAEAEMGMWQELAAAKNGTAILRLNGMSYLFSDRVTPLFGWRIVRLLPTERMLRPIWQMISVSLVLAVLLLTVAGTILYRISRRVSRPISQLHAGMRLVQEGDFTVRVDPGVPGELGQLVDGFNQMTRELGDSLQREYKAQFLALQSQINPHFLYNALSSIQMMALLNKDFEVSRALVLLGDLFRYAAAEPAADGLVELEQELNNAGNYIRLEQIRCAHVIGYTMEVPYELRSSPVPKMILQPLVENCFKHGELDQRDDSFISLWSRREERGFRLRIENNGNDIPTERLEEIRDLLHSGELGADSIGIYNVNNRLIKRFGGRSGLSIGNRGEGGVWIELYFDTAAAD